MVSTSARDTQRAQTELFTINYNPEQAAPSDAPMCPSCRLRPVTWWAKQSRWYRYCGQANCTNHERKCMWCDKVYDRNALRAGTKYCGDECKQQAYMPHARDLAARPPCRFCGGPTRSNGAVCKKCIRSVPWANALRSHNTPEWLWLHMSTDGTCMNPGCGEDLTGRNKRSDSGAYYTQVNVDHNHSCCEHNTCCGRCVRGVLCLDCNQALGKLRNSARRIAGLGTYLEMSSVKT